MKPTVVIALLLVLPLVFCQDIESDFDVETRLSLHSLVDKLLHSKEVKSLGCKAVCSAIAGWVSFLCPAACKIVVDKLGKRDIEY